MSSYLKYVPYGDILTMLLMITFVIIYKSSFYGKTLKNRIFKISIVSVSFSAFTNILYMCTTKSITLDTNAFYFLRFLSNMFLNISFSIYSIYLVTMYERNKKRTNRVILIDAVLIVISLLLVAVLPYYKIGNYLDLKTNTYVGKIFYEPFIYTYIVFSIIFLYELYYHRKYLITRANKAMLAILILSSLISLYGLLTSNMTFLTFTFTLPMLLVFTLFHSNSYDPDTGTLNPAAFDEYLNDLSKRNKKFSLISLLFISEEYINVFLKEIQKELTHFNESFFCDSYTFRLNEKRFVLVYRKTKKAYSKEKFEMAFYKLYEKYSKPFKMVIIKSNPLLEEEKRNLTFVKFIEEKMNNNTIYEANDKDLIEFLHRERILEELKNIKKKKNLNDERVLLYGQPIYSNDKKKFTSAESLIRLKIDDEIIYPNDFIKLAEDHNIIHTLTLIMLNKACLFIKDCTKEGKIINRISVNISVIEFKNSKLVDEIKSIIKKNKIPFSKIGIEITESKDIDESNEILEKLKELSKLGIKIYLDDFGTGYSNFERIMKYPFNVIKFDKTLLDNSNTDKKIKLLTKYFSEAFIKLDYKILFEGVETEKDAKLCTSSFKSNYLQGYLYSKPVPYESLKEFFKKK